MAGFQLLLDAASEATGTQLDVSDGAVNNGVGYRLLALDVEDPANKTTYADSVSTWGGIPSFPHGLGPATINVSLRVTGSTAGNLLTKLNALREKLHKFNREGGTVRVVYPSTDTLTFDVLEAQPQGQAFDNAFVARSRATQVAFKLICKPGGRGQEQTLGTFTETALPVLTATITPPALAYNVEVLADSPALYWRLGELSGTNANDETANNRDGTYGSGVTLGYASALLGAADTSVLLNDSGTGRINSTYAPYTAATTRVFEGWAWRNDMVGADTLFSGDGANRPEFRLGAGNQNVLWRANDVSPTITWTNAWPGNERWVHWVLIFRDVADTVSLYINGTLVSTQAEVSTYGATPGNFQVGAIGSGNSSPWNGRIDEIAVYTAAPTDPRILAHFQAGVGGIAGSLLANGRAVMTATQGDQWTVFTGVQSRYYDSSADAALFYEAEGRTPLGGAAIAVGSATPSGAGSNVMRQGTLTPMYQAMMSTTSLGGTPLAHIGSFEVLARVYRPTTNTGAVSLYLEWGAGDFQTPTKNDAINFAADAYEGQWLLCKLGPVHIPKATQGTQKWEGRIVAKSTVVGDDVDIDWIGLCPTTAEGDPACYGEWSGIQRFDTPTSFSARDEFDSHSAGNLTTKTAPVGGAWTGGGDTNDLLINAPGPPRTTRVNRGDLSDTAPRVDWLPTSLTNIAVQADVSPGTIGRSGGTTSQEGADMVGIAATVDASNYFSLSIKARNSERALQVIRTIAGAQTVVASMSLEGKIVFNGWYRLRLKIDAGGRWWAYFGDTASNILSNPNTDTDPALVMVGQDDLLATGGTLATRKPGLVDYVSQNASGALPTRTYENFAAFVPAADAGCFSGQSLEIRHDRAERENAGGTTWNRVSSRRGKYLRFAPASTEGRTNRLFVKGVRGQQVQTNVWADPNIDDIAVDLFATPLGVVVPEP